MLHARHLALATGVAALLAGASVTITAASDDVPFPASFRTWAHVKTVLVGPASAAKTELGFHHIYANEQALAGYRTGTFPDGSVIVYELLGTTEKDGAILEGAEKRVDVMVKDARRFAASAGWAFGSFPGGARTGSLAADRQAGCLTCHTKRKEHDYVQSDWRP
jgi:hypothetical protein